MTLEDHYSGQHGHDAESFHRYLFWYCVPWRVRLLVWLIRVCRPSFFTADDRFIIGLGEARSIEEVRREAHCFLQDRSNRAWLRRVAKVRMSATRAIGFSKAYLPERIR
jgi:hypothetical protein